MRFRFFTIPAFDPDAAQDTFNVFCAQHHIVDSDRYVVDRGIDSFWAVYFRTVGANSFARSAMNKRSGVPSLRGRMNSPLQVRVCARWETP